MDNFKLVGIDVTPFEGLFKLTDEQLKKYLVRRCHSTANHGFPCRVSLEDAREGEELLLLPFLHQPAATPYRAYGPIYVRKGARRRVMPAGEVPDYVSSRLISVRAYDTAHMLVSATVCDGIRAAAEFDVSFDQKEVAYLHVHSAKPGCFLCQVLRA